MTPDAKQSPWVTMRGSPLNNVFQLSQAIMSSNIRWPWKMEKTVKAAIKKFLAPDDRERVGSKAHPVGNAVAGCTWCDGIQWLDVLNMRLMPRYKPTVADAPQVGHFAIKSAS